MYRCALRTGEEVKVDNPSELPDEGLRDHILEPYVRCVLWNYLLLFDLKIGLLIYKWLRDHILEPYVQCVLCASRKIIDVNLGHVTGCTSALRQQKGTVCSCRRPQLLPGESAGRPPARRGILDSGSLAVPETCARVPPPLLQDGGHRAKGPCGSVRTGANW